jgi:hypothetical protein
MDGGCRWDRSGPLGQERMRVIYAGAMAALGSEGVFAHVWRHILILRLILLRQSAYAVAAVASVSVGMIDRVCPHYDMGAVQRLAHGALAGMMAPRKAA